MVPLLKISNITKCKHHASDGVLFKDVTAEMNRGERIALIGASGTGKSTLLRILARLESMDEGIIELHGNSSVNVKSNDWRKKVCYVAQSPVMLQGSVEQNLRMVSQLHELPFEESLAKRCMAAVELGHLDWSKSAADLSGGEKQRTALVRSLLLRPDLLLLDETTSSLDPSSKAAVEQLLNEWTVEQGTAMIWITHDLEQARHISDHVWLMGEGSLLEKSGTAAFFNEPVTEQGKRFISKHKQSAKEVFADE
ncbi:MAG: ATP-binding cassette domain-containing protein [Candidatus Pristimantibacillus sp.]